VCKPGSYDVPVEAGKIGSVKGSHSVFLGVAVAVSSLPGLTYDQAKEIAQFLLPDDKWLREKPFKVFNSPQNVIDRTVEYNDEILVLLKGSEFNIGRNGSLILRNCMVIGPVQPYTTITFNVQDNGRLIIEGSFLCGCKSCHNRKCSQVLSATNQSRVILKDSMIHMWSDACRQGIYLTGSSKMTIDFSTVKIGWVDGGVSVEDNARLVASNSLISADRIEWDQKRVQLSRSFVHRTFILRVVDKAGRPLSPGASLMGAYPAWSRHIIPEYAITPKEALDLLFRYHKQDLNSMGEATLDAYFSSELTPKFALVGTHKSRSAHVFVEPTSPKKLTLTLPEAAEKQ